MHFLPYGDLYADESVAVSTTRQQKSQARCTVASIIAGWIP